MIHDGARPTERDPARPPGEAATIRELQARSAKTRRQRKGQYRAASREVHVHNLPEIAVQIDFDGVLGGRLEAKFFHGGVYKVPRSQYNLIMEMAYRTKTHQLEIDGKSRYKWQGWNDPRIGHDPRASIHGKVNTTTNMQRV